MGAEKKRMIWKSEREVEEEVEAEAEAEKERLVGKTEKE